MGHLGGSVGWVSNFGSGHDLIVRVFEPCIRLCADSSEPGTCFGFCVSLSIFPSSTHSLSLSVSQKMNKHFKNFKKNSTNLKKKKKEFIWHRNTQINGTE